MLICLPAKARIAYSADKFKNNHNKNDDDGRFRRALQLVGLKNVCVCFAGAWEWEHLQEALEEKLKNSLAVSQLMDCIRSLIGRERVKSFTLIIASCLLFNCLPQKLHVPQNRKEVKLRRLY